jgi:hypothetical protein
VSDEHGSAADTGNRKLIYVVAVPLLEEVAEVGAASGVAFAELELMAHYGRAWFLSWFGRDLDESPLAGAVNGDWLGEWSEYLSHGIGVERLVLGGWPVDMWGPSRGFHGCAEHEENNVRRLEVGREFAQIVRHVLEEGLSALAA